MPPTNLEEGVTRKRPVLAAKQKTAGETAVLENAMNAGLSDSTPSL